MARPRKFDEGDVLQKAMMVFWQNGYDATTMRVLQEACGVDGKGLANAFGDKEAIFVRVLDAYISMASGVLDQVFARPSLAALETFFGAMLQPTETPEDPRNQGCLMVNTVFELGRASETVRERVTAYRDMFLERFCASLQAEGIGQSDERGEFLVGLLWGALSQIRLSGTVASARPIVTVALDTIDQWKTEQRS